ncbi:MAG: hypothetical protein QME64_04720 [bacterium]|nr:hypothetical protein [bacterium]
MPIRRVRVPDWGLVFLVFLSGYLLMFGRAQEYSYADGSLMFNVTKSIVEDGRVTSRVPGLYRGSAYIAQSKYGLGFSIFTVPFYGAAKLFAVMVAPLELDTITRLAPMLANIFITAFTGAVLYAFGSRLFQDKQIALMVTALYGFASNALPYSRYDFAEPLTGLCILIAIYTLVRFQHSQKIAWLWFSSLAVSYAMFTRIVSAMVILIWLLELFRWFKKEKIPLNLNLIMGITVPIFITLVLFFWYNYARYGSLLITGYEADIEHSRFFFTSILTGMYGLLLSPGKGILWYSPPVFLSLLAFPIFWNENRKLCMLFLAIVIIHLVIYSGWVAWEGGWCWGPRHLVPIVPLLILPIGFWLKSIPWAKVVWLIIFSIGVFVQWLGIVYPFNFYIQAMLDQGAQFQDLLFKQQYNPITGNLTLVFGLPWHLWDFAIIPLRSSSYRNLTIIIATILLFLFGTSGTILLRRVGITRTKQL